MMTNHRQLAINALNNLIASQEPLPDSFGQWPASAKHLLLQTCRYFDKLQTIMLHLSHKPPKDAFVIAVLSVGLCELFIDKKPHHAVINELVQLTKKSKKHSFASGFVNGLLRQAIRQESEWKEALRDNMVYAYAHPQWYIKRMKSAWPSDWQAILEANNQHPPMTLRVNQQRTKREDYLKQISHGSQPTQYSEVGIQLSAAIAITDLPGFQEGTVSVQDEAAQLAASYLELEPNLRVLDACAAPGGKTCHMLESEPSIECVAIEAQQERFNRLKQGLQRLHLKAQCLLADASDTKSWWDGQAFDRILIDAPCSGTGVIRRHPDIKLRRNPKHLLMNTPIQAQLLKHLWPLLKPQGLLVYATCSVIPEENDLQIQKFLEAHPDAQLKAFPFLVGIKTKFGQQIVPATAGMDGFYYAILEKKMG